MKIGYGPQDNGIGQTQGTTGTPNVSRQLGTKGSTSSQSGLDRVDVSDVAQTAARVLSATSAQRSQYVANLTQQYQSGQYVVDSSRLTTAIINHDSTPDPIAG